MIGAISPGMSEFGNPSSCFNSDHSRILPNSELRCGFCEAIVVDIPYEEDPYLTSLFLLSSKISSGFSTERIWQRKDSDVYRGDGESLHSHFRPGYLLEQRIFRQD